MKIFIWETATHVTDNYHSGGGIAVVAETLERARELLWNKQSSAMVEVPRVFSLSGDVNEEVIVFPDAGCC